MIIDATLKQYWEHYEKAASDKKSIHRPVLVIKEYDNKTVSTLVGFFSSKKEDLDNEVYIIDCDDVNIFKGIRKEIIYQPRFNVYKGEREEYFPTDKPIILIFRDFDKADKDDKSILQQLVQNIKMNHVKEIFPHKDSILIYHSEKPDMMRLNIFGDYYNCVMEEPEEPQKKGIHGNKPHNDRIDKAEGINKGDDLYY
jgi:hypothetical protein